MKTTKTQNIIKSKFKLLAVFGLLMLCMNSCVYSLFPIYTEDTLVFNELLLGKWQTEGETEDYLQFIKMTEKEEAASGIFKKKVTYTDSIYGADWKIKSNGPITIEVDGQKISDTDSIKMYYESIMSRVSNGNKASENKFTASDDDSEVPEVLQELHDKNEFASSFAKFEGSAHVVLDESYKLIVMDDGERLIYQAHLVQIGVDLFLDLYPLAEFSNSEFGNNLFPVHTFMKVEIKDDELDLIFFNLKKLNDLFENNLIRLRHEKVDGTVLITAQPKEIQKFLKKYSKDESVFESVETYKRVKL